MTHSEIIRREPLSKDRLAVAVAIFCLLLLFVFFFALNRNIEGISQEIHELQRINASLVTLDSRRAVLDGKVTDLQSLPRHTRLMALENQVRIMSHATADLDRQLHGEHRDKLQAVQRLLEEIGEDIHNTK